MWAYNEYRRLKYNRCDTVIVVDLNNFSYYPCRTMLLVNSLVTTIMTQYIYGIQYCQDQPLNDLGLPAIDLSFFHVILDCR